MKSKIYASVGLIGLVGGASVAWASGLALRQQSVRSSSMALAGDGVANGDATSVFANPATVTSADQQTFTLGLTYVSMDKEWSEGKSSIPSTSSSTSITESGTAPALAGMHPITKQFSVGWGFSVPFGGSVDYKKDWIGRYYGTKTQFEVRSFDVVGGFRLNKMVGFGAGLQYQMADATIARAADLGTIVGSKDPSLANPGKMDSVIEFKGDSSGTGFVFGVSVDPTSTLHLGLGYRSPVKHKLKGDSVWQDQSAMAGTVRGQLGAAMPVFKDNKAELEMTAPQVINLGGEFELSKAVSLFANINRTQWSSISDLTIEYPSANAVNRTQLNYHNTTSVSLGGAFALNHNFSVRGGLGFDPEVADDKDKTPATVDGDRRVIGLGGTFSTKEFAVDAGLTYYNVSDYTVDQKKTSYSDNNLRGDLSAKTSTSIMTYMIGGSYFL